MADLTNAPILDGTGQNIVEKLDLIARRVGSGSGGSGGSGTSDYTDLDNKPQINGVTLTGNKSLSQLGIQSELAFDNTPTQNSNNPVKSGGVYDAINGITEVSSSQAEADWEAVFGNAYVGLDGYVPSFSITNLDSSSVDYND